MISILILGYVEWTRRWLALAADCRGFNNDGNTPDDVLVYGMGYQAASAL